MDTMEGAQTGQHRATDDQTETIEGEQSGYGIQIVTSPQLNVPSLDFLSRKERCRYISICLPIYQAALKGDWEAVRGIVEVNPSVVRSAITKRGETALHIAAAARHIHFVEELVKEMTKKDLELQNQYGNTALCFAAAAGTVRIAEVMVNKNRDLTLIRGNQGMTPLHMAALLGQSNMVWYLYKETSDDHLSDSDRIGILNACISTGLYDVALDMLSRHGELALARDADNETALHILARKPCAFSANQTQHSIWKRFIN